MGRPKLLLPWRGRTVLGHLVGEWNEVGAAQIAVVHANDAPEIVEELERLGFAREQRILNPAPERGMFSSIQCAAGWRSWDERLTHWIISLGDQPHLRVRTLQTLLEFGRTHPDAICQPQRNGRPKHPVLMPKKIFSALKNSSARDLKEFLAANVSDFAGVELDDAGLDFDLDTPDDYERLQQWD